MAHAPKLRYVDPYKRRGRLYLALCRFSATKAGALFSVNIAWKLDPHLLTLTRGRLGTGGRLPQPCSSREGHGQVSGVGMPRSTSTTAIG